jgi:zinc protease
MKPQRFIVSLFLMLSLCLTAFTQNKMTESVQKVTSVEGITEYRLPNGLKVLLFPDQTKQTITVNVTYLVGSRQENYGETGMAHLLEHMAFKGTPKHANIPLELSQHGGQYNASTSFDRTNYFETMPASDESLNFGLELEADRMVNSFIAKKDLSSEFSVVRNEFESGENSPIRVLLDKMLASAYQWHNYGNTVIGARSDIENVPIDRLQAYYKKYYQPDNAVLLVAGKFDEAKALAAVNKYFAPIPKPARELPPNYTIEPTQDGERQVTVRRVGDTQWVMAGYHLPPGAQKDYAAVDILFQTLGDTPSGRLYKALVEPKKASSLLYITFEQKEPGFGLFGAEVRKENSLDEARDILTKTIETIGANPPTKEEVDRAKASILKNIELTLNSSDRVGLGLSEYIAQGDWRLFFLYRDRIRQVAPEDVKRVAAVYLKPANRTLGLFIPTEKPDRAEIPGVSETDLAAMLKDYKGDAAIAAGESFDPTTVNIESRVKRADIGTVKAAFLPKKTRGESVIVQLILDFGSEKSLMNRSSAAQLAGQMLMRGTTKHTRQQLQDEFDRLKARVNVFPVGATSAVASIETTKENLPAALRLVAEVLREPAYPASEFETLKQSLLTGIEGQKSEPGAVAGNQLSKHFNVYPKGHPFYPSSIDESIVEINAVTLDQIKAFYRDFYGASNARLSIVGDFDEKQISALTGELFGNWKSPQPYTRIKREYKDIAPINQSFETPDKANAVFVARLNLNLRDDNPDFPALTVANFIIGEGTLESRLGVRLRQKEGLTYGVGSRLAAGSLDPNGAFSVQAIYAPQNAAKLETGFKEEIARALKDGFTKEEVEAAKLGFLQARQVSRAQDRELVGRLNSYLLYNRTLAFDADLEQKIQALTPEQVNAAARKYITPDKITIIKAGDFAKSQVKSVQ